MTLAAEYERDVRLGKEISVPFNYYPEDDPKSVVYQRAPEPVRNIHEEKSLFQGFHEVPDVVSVYGLLLFARLGGWICASRSSRGGPPADGSSARGDLCLLPD